MVKMINALFGGEMWVAEDRVEEYLKAGHRLAEPPKAKPKKTAKKSTKKK